MSGKARTGERPPDAIFASITFDEYLSPARFPLTTRPGITSGEQVAADVLDLGHLRELRATGHVLARDELARLAELETKAAARPEMLGKPDGVSG